MPAEDALAARYGEAQGTAETEADGTAHFQMDKVSAGKDGNIRVAYDADLFPNVAITAGKTIRDEIMRDITDQEAKREAFEKRKSIHERIAPYIIVVFVIYIFALLFAAWRKKQAMNMEIMRTVSNRDTDYGMILILPGVLFAVHDLFMWMLISIVLSVLLLLFAAFYHPKTLKGSRIQSSVRKHGGTAR